MCQRNTLPVKNKFIKNTAMPKYGLYFLLFNYWAKDHGRLPKPYAIIDLALLPVFIALFHT
jgi:hypothetical protein